MKTACTSTRARLLEVETKALECFCNANVTAATEEILRLLHEKDYAKLVNFEVNPRMYTEQEIDLFRIDYQAASMLKKSQVVPIDVDKRRKALDKFHQAEQQCDEANFRIRSWAYNPKDAPWLIDVVAKAQLIIRQILGPLDSESLEFVETHCRFGPGSTGTVKRRPTQGRKFDNHLPSVSPRLAEAFLPAMPALWADRLSGVECRSYIGITTVAKNAKTDRTIGIEPDLNIYVQLGIGALIRNRLLQSGLNLAKQADRNAYLASRAHALELSTIDLSSASDCVSRSLVELLLPEEWRHLLWLARSDYYELDGRISPFSKWSSMGNGYTFELETLIFWALARASGDSKAVAYGDDIIIARRNAKLLLDTLNFLGFSVNEEKTFLDGLFFESCGTDWFCGVNVRPFFLKGNINDTIEPKGQFLATLYTYANSISAAAYRANCGHGRDRRYFSTWRSVFKTAPPSDRHRIPAGFSTSGGFECDWDECSNLVTASSFSYLAFTPERGKVRGDWGPYLSWHNAAQRRVISGREPVKATMVGIQLLSLDLANQDLKSDSYHRDGEAYRYEGSHKTKVGSCFAWPTRGAWM